MFVLKEESCSLNQADGSGLIENKSSQILKLNLKLIEGSEILQIFCDTAAEKEELWILVVVGCSQILKLNMN